MNEIKDLLVLKLGTSTLTNDAGVINTNALALIVEQAAKLHSSHRIAIVSSGAVAAGRGHIVAYGGHSTERKAAAAIGNHTLMRLYNEQFAQANVVVAQILCDRDAFTNRKRFLGLQETLATLWSNNIIPIINENDVTSSQELSFSDNDELAALFAIGFGAKQLLIGTSVAGLLNAGTVVKQIDSFTEATFSLVESHISSFGLGGMASKLRWSECATKSGVEVVIFDARVVGHVLLANERRTGTLCSVKEQGLAAVYVGETGV